MEQKNNEIEIDIRELAEAILSKWTVVLFVTILTGIFAFAFAKLFMTPQYRSTTSIYVLNQQNANSVTYSDLQASLQLTDDYKIIIKSRSVLQEVIDTQGLSLTYEALSGKVAVTGEDNSRVVNISVTDADPYQAREIADAICAVAVEKIQSVTGVDEVNVIEEANIPSAPYSPNVKKITLIGMVIGFVLSAGVIVLIFITNDMIYTPDDVEKYLGLSTLASIPFVSDQKKRRSKKAKGKAEVR